MSWYPYQVFHHDIYHSKGDYRNQDIEYPFVHLDHFAYKAIKMENSKNKEPRYSEALLYCVVWFIIG